MIRRPRRPWMKQYTRPWHATVTGDSAEAERTTGPSSLARCSTQARSDCSTSCDSTPASSAATMAFADSSCTCLYGCDTPSCNAGTMPASTSTRTSSEIAALLRRRLASKTCKSRSLLTCACDEASPSPVPRDRKAAAVDPLWAEEPMRNLAICSTAVPSAGSVSRGRRRLESPKRLKHRRNCQFRMFSSSAMRSSSAAIGPMAAQSARTSGSGQRLAARSVPANTSTKRTWSSASLLGWRCSPDNSRARSSTSAASPLRALKAT
mmetsp:Transcript_127120/g.395647  ORF Transcript_127120/g.395647 Transcript_127120/m.395647 type:complete len:265 (+) Transcript_127120:905-1699(+)